MMGKVKTHTLLSGALVTGAGASIQPLGAHKSFHAFGSVSATTGAAAIGVECSNDGVNFVEVDELTLTLGTDVTSDYYETTIPWKFIRGNVKSISGTDAEVTLIVGCQW